MGTSCGRAPVSTGASLTGVTVTSTRTAAALTGPVVLLSRSCRLLGDDDVSHACARRWAVPWKFRFGWKRRRVPGASSTVWFSEGCAGRSVQPATAETHCCQRPLLASVSTTAMPATGASSTSAVMLAISSEAVRPWLLRLGTSSMMVGSQRVAAFTTIGWSLTGTTVTVATATAAL